MKHLLKKSLFVTSLSAVALFSSPNRPFPQELEYPGCIKPSNVTQSAMNKSVEQMFDYYKSTYVTKAKNTAGGYYTNASGNGGGGKSAVTVSEAHGYGMIIFALMAGYDSEAQTIFDGYFKFYKDHPSKVNPICMSWEVDSDESDKANDGATDGDMDIAYALLLAHYQWGSDGDINYLEEAKKIINKGIKVSDIHASNLRTTLGDWDGEDDADGDTKDITRSSDWMPDHFRAYATATGDNFWNDVADTVYSLVKSIQDNYSPNVGLISDFVKGTPPAPDKKAGGTGESNGGDYSYNGCRDPWRLATDYAHYGTQDAKDALVKMDSWLRSSTNGDPDKIYAGYKLTGKKLVDYNQLTFTAPFTAGLIADSNSQDFLNNCWNAIENDHGEDAYELALNLMSMLLISGNWWAPAPITYSKPKDIILGNSQIGEGLGKNTLVTTISTKGGLAPYQYELTQGTGDFFIRHDSLFTAKVFDASQNNEIAIEITSTDAKNNSKTKSFDIEVTKSSDNMAQYLAWWVDIDEYGVTSLDTGSALMNDTSIAVTFNVGTSNEKKDEWVYGILSCDSLSKNLGNSRFITIEYRTTNSFTLTMQMGKVKDDAYHYVELPITDGAWKTITLNIDAATFKQPSDWGDRVDFDPSDVQQFAFNTNFESDTGTIEIRTLQIDGFTAPKVALKNNVTVNNKQFSVRSVNNNLILSVDKKAAYSISVYNLRGQMLIKKQVMLNSGINNLNLNLSSISGPVIIRLNGGDVSGAKKMILK